MFEKIDRFWDESVNELIRNNWDYTKQHAMKILNINDPNSPLLSSILLCASMWGIQVID